MKWLSARVTDALYTLQTIQGTSSITRRLGYAATVCRQVNSTDPLEQRRVGDAASYLSSIAFFSFRRLGLSFGRV
jgi:hypothetical protein